MTENLRILAVADVHGYEKAVYMIRELYSRYSPDLIVVAGDITNFGPASFAEKFLNLLPGEVMAIPGNCDPPEVIKAIERSKAINLHKRIVEFRGYKFIGLGGVNGGFNLGIKFDDDFAEKFLGDCKKCVFLLHQPPYGILDDVGGENHIGSLGIRKAVEKAEPIAVISGHVHEARGYKITERTIFVNPGPARMNYASIIDLNKRLVEMIR